MHKPIPGVRLALLLAAAMMLTHCGGEKEEADDSSVVSCDKIQAHGVCEEFVNQNPDEIREYGCKGGSFAPSSCLQERVMAKCETQRGYSDPDQSKVYYYYHLTEGYTISDLQSLCDDVQGVWIEYLPDQGFEAGRDTGGESVVGNTTDDGSQPKAGAGSEYVGKWKILGGPTGDTILILVIEEDSTFRINGIEGGNDYTVAGKWAVERFLVVLNVDKIKGMTWQVVWVATMHDGKLHIARGDLGPELIFDGN